MHKTLELSLLDNALSFLEEALINARAAETNPKRWKFAVLHLVQAIELCLKESLRNEHPWLIYRSVDKRSVTVSLEEAVARLASLQSLNLSQDDRVALKLAAEKRNDLVHHSVSIDPGVLKPAFAKLLGLVTDIDHNLLDSSLQTKMRPEVWRRALLIREYAAEVQQRALPRYTDEIRVADCPDCGWRALAIDEDNQGRCGVCLLDEEFTFCERCDCALVLSTEEQSNRGTYCQSCFEYVDHDHWHDVLKDRRGS